MIQIGKISALMTVLLHAIIVKNSEPASMDVEINTHQMTSTGFVTSVNLVKTRIHPTRIWAIR